MSAASLAIDTVQNKEASLQASFPQLCTDDLDLVVSVEKTKLDHEINRINAAYQAECAFNNAKLQDINQWICRIPSHQIPSAVPHNTASPDVLKNEPASEEEMNGILNEIKAVTQNAGVFNKRIAAEKVSSLAALYTRNCYAAKQYYEAQLSRLQQDNSCQIKALQDAYQQTAAQAEAEKQKRAQDLRKQQLSVQTAIANSWDHVEQVFVSCFDSKIKAAYQRICYENQSGNIIGKLFLPLCMDCDEAGKNTHVPSVNLVRSVKNKLPGFHFEQDSLVMPLRNNPLEGAVYSFQSKDPQKKADTFQKQFIDYLLMSLLIGSYEITLFDPVNFGLHYPSLTALKGSLIVPKIYATQEELHNRLQSIITEEKEAAVILSQGQTFCHYQKQNAGAYRRHIIIFNSDILSDANQELCTILQNNATIYNTIILYSGTQDSSCTQNIFSKDDTLYYCIGKPDSTLSMPVFQPVKLPAVTTAQLSAISTYKTPEPDCDYRFSTFFPRHSFFHHDDAAASLWLSFLTDAKSNRYMFELGGTQSAHMLLSGATGSGKTSALHALIASLALTYTPDEVELWLVDFKINEFGRYIHTPLPHINFIGTFSDDRLILSLLERIESVFNKRKAVFQQYRVKDYQEYCTVAQAPPMPRIVVIIDEFHRMTQCIAQSKRHAVILENALSEYRSLGLSFVFSDQAVLFGLNGLTDKGRAQILVRLAMRNPTELSEIKATLALSNTQMQNDALNKAINELNTGDVLVRGVFHDEGRAAVSRLAALHSMFITKSDLEAIHAELSKRYPGHKAETIVTDGMRGITASDIDTFEKSNRLLFSAGLPVYIGSRVSLSPIAYFTIKQQAAQNIILIGLNDELRAALLFNCCYSFLRHASARVTVISPSDDPLLARAAPLLARLSRINILNDADSIRSFLQKQLTQLSQHGAGLLVILGIDVLLEMLQEPKAGKPMPPASRQSDSVETLQELISQLNDNGTVPSTKKPVAESAQENFDAEEAIAEIIRKGPRRNHYTLVVLDTLRQARHIRGFQQDEFMNVLLLKSSINDSSYLINRSDGAKLDDHTAIYSYGGGEIVTFTPTAIQQS